MENNKTVAPETIARVRTCVALAAMVVAGMGSFFFEPFLILSAYFIFSAFFKLVVHSQNSFIEKFWFGPVKLATSGFMIMAGIPTDNHILAVVWVGISLLFMVSGGRSVFAAIRAGQAEAANVTPVPTQTARQLAKASKTEDALFSDLADFLGDADSHGEGNKES
jgi:hypothetical protein